MRHPIAPYVHAWRERCRRNEEAMVKLRQEARSILPVLVRRLAEAYGIRRIDLVGSLARGDLRHGSDIDLWVEGLAPERYFDASAEINRLSAPFRVDLAMAERARPEVAQLALRDAEVLYIA